MLKTEATVKLGEQTIGDQFPVISRLCTRCLGSLWEAGSWSTGAAVVVGTAPRPQRPVGGAVKRTRQRAR